MASKSDNYESHERSPDLSLFAARVREVVGETSVRAFAREAQIDEKSLRKYLEGTGEPGLANLRRLAARGGVTVEWLATGEGPRDPAVLAAVSGCGPSLADFALVPRYDIRAAAGGGALVQSEQVVDHLAFKRSWLRHEGISPSRCALIEATGDSMEPTISAGDLVLVALDQINPASEGVFVLRRRNALLIKRLQLLHTGQLQIRSDNPGYQVELVAPQDIQALQLVGRVRWVGRRFTGRYREGG